MQPQKPQKGSSGAGCMEPSFGGVPALLTSRGLRPWERAVGRGTLGLALVRWGHREGSHSEGGPAGSKSHGFHMVPRLTQCFWPRGVWSSQQPPNLVEANGVLTPMTVRKAAQRGVAACWAPGSISVL